MADIHLPARPGARSGVKFPPPEAGGSGRCQERLLVFMMARLGPCWCGDLAPPPLLLPFDRQTQRLLAWQLRCACFPRLSQLQEHVAPGHGRAHPHSSIAAQGGRRRCRRRPPGPRVAVRDQDQDAGDCAADVADVAGSVQGLDAVYHRGPLLGLRPRRALLSLCHSATSSRPYH
jgi:hypothetical protein